MLDAFFANLLQPNRDVAIDSGKLGIANRLRDIDLAVDAVNFHRAFNFTGSYRTVNAVGHEGNLSWQSQGHVFRRLGTKHARQKALVALVATDGESLGIVFNRNLAPVQNFLALAGSFNVDVGGFGVGSFNLHPAIDAGHLHARAGRELEALANFLAGLFRRMLVGMNEERPAVLLPLVCDRTIPATPAIANKQDEKDNFLHSDESPALAKFVCLCFNDEMQAFGSLKLASTKGD